MCAPVGFRDSKTLRKFCFQVFGANLRNIVPEKISTYTVPLICTLTALPCVYVGGVPDLHSGSGPGAAGEPGWLRQGPQGWDCQLILQAH